MKQCTSCGLEKDYSEFNKRRASLDGYKPICRSCQSEQAREYDLTHKESISERIKIWYKNNVQWVKEYEKANKEHITERKKLFRINNPEKMRLKDGERRARKANAEGHFTAEDVIKIYNEQNGLCYYCGCEVGDDYHIDHKQPLARGGSNWPENLAISCAFDNLSKGAKTEEEYLLCLQQ